MYNITLHSLQVQQTVTNGPKQTKVQSMFNISCTTEIFDLIQLAVDFLLQCIENTTTN